MTFNQMRYFIAVADSLSFTDAAQSLFLTQPALSRQIAALEQELGTSLFIRNRNGLQLTPSGMLLYQKLPDMLRDLELLISQVQMSDKGFTGELNIGFLDIYDTSRYFTKIIQEFTTLYPDINLSMYYMSSD
ncbi:MAG: LysR family transcriptional regulator, partial [Parasporobacterium sp.]|nr:LysR family transcriptional regulator [Parasporobacterium sp.]